jgi:tyrosyl-tRNA synthetase
LRQYFTLLTDVPLDEVDRLLAPGVNPRDAKETLAKTIIAGLASREEADGAAAEFRKRARGEDPDAIREVDLAPDQLDAEGRMPAPRLVVALGLETSTSNARRVIEGGGLTIGPDRVAVRDWKALVDVTDGLIVRVGKHKIVKVRRSPAG